MSPKQDRAARRYVVFGRVQGVGFRYFTQHAANTIGVAGWVRNLPNGTVEAEAVGSPDQLEAFEAALREGPRLSRVERVAVSPAPLRDEPGFRIKG